MAKKTINKNDSASLIPNANEYDVTNTSFDIGDFNDDDLPDFLKDTDDDDDDDHDDIDVVIDDSVNKKGKKKKEVKDDDVDDADDNDDNNDVVVEKDDKKKNKNKPVDDDANDDDDDDDSGNDDSDDNTDESITSLFDAIAESAGWAIEEDEKKPSNPDELIEYLIGVIEENSKPEFANEKVRELDEYIRNGGKFEDYAQVVTGSIDYENVDLTDEYNQKAVISEFLKEKGFAPDKIYKKLEKYSSVGILAEEAEEALDSLKEIIVEKREAAVTAQKAAALQEQKQRKEFFDSVVSEIEAIEEIRGVKINKAEKKELLNHIFKIESDGLTGYQREYGKTVKNLIESAYFTHPKLGANFVNTVKKSGETTAVEKFRNSMKTNKVKGSKDKKMISKSDSDWSMFSLLNK